jgi:hypothetical protein
MKKLLFLLLIIAAHYSIAQPPVYGGRMFSNVQGLKIAFITQELNLTPEESQRFWPVYYDYGAESNLARKEKKDDMIGLDERLLAIKKKYFIEFRKVLGSNERANKVFVCDRDFGNFIKIEIENRQRMRSFHPPSRHR